MRVAKRYLVLSTGAVSKGVRPSESLATGLGMWRQVCNLPRNLASCKLAATARHRFLRTDSKANSFLAPEPGRQDARHLLQAVRGAIGRHVAQAVPVRVIEVDDVDGGNAHPEQ